VLWALALLLRVLYFRFNRYNAHGYDASVRQVQQAWWKRHRQQASLVDTVLLGPQCVTPDQRAQSFNAGLAEPVAQTLAGGTALRVRQVVGLDVATRERQLAKLLVAQWLQQTPEVAGFDVRRCYWNGSPAGWQAFVEQLACHRPQVRLPAHPTPWEGLHSLDAIIDQLHAAPAGTRILCAGCESAVPQFDAAAPAGEAALLWVFALQGGVGVCRGEWFTEGAEPLERVAERALCQSDLALPASVCVSLFPSVSTDVGAVGLSAERYPQDARFGRLPLLGAMVAQTLAAWHAYQQGEPCAWLANDPHHTLTLGVVKPNDKNN